MNHKQNRLQRLGLLLLLILPSLACNLSIVKQPMPAAMSNQLIPTTTALPSPTSTPILTSTASLGVCKVTAEVLHLRTAPSIDGTVIAWLIKGDVLVVLRSPAAESWWEVETADHRTGWINSLYCERISKP